ncbi:SURF1 family protein [Rugamonas apoptosis]|uniref:SURF1 family protein n=1 Tax=Rugamonas apoptosis TaxID=2758570 RepID=UPI001E3AF1FA|nr:SURF1 family protein [Rugamonas apoptosis]
MRFAWLAGAALMLAGFLALGCWQLWRLQWKLDLIGRVNQRVHAAPVPAPGPSLWPHLTATTDEYLRITAAGNWLPNFSTRVQASTEQGTGFWLLTPLCRPDGTILLINRGFVPARPGDYNPAAPSRAQPNSCLPHAAGGPDETTITGPLRLSEPRGSVVRYNDAATSRWYSRDVDAIAGAHRLRRVAPYFLDAEADADAASPDGAHPVGGLTVISFRNNHLVYALTWFALALMAAGACLLLTRDKWTRRDGESK